jgi:FKBP-type peptidyl-prolyl cis-trans isomerase
MMRSGTIKYSMILLSLGALFLASGCKEEPTNEKRDQEQRFFDLYISSTFKDTIPPPTASGLYFIEVKQGNGDAPDTDDWMIVNYVGYVIPEGEVVDTYLENVARASGVYSDAAMYGPFKLQNGSRTEGLTEGMLKMREGGQAIMCFTSDLGYGANAIELMKTVPAYKSLRYEVELVKVIKDIEAYEQAKIEAFVNTIEGVDTIHDPYADAIMYYIIDEPNNGSLIKDDSVVEVAYRGYLIDGRQFDESDPDAPYEFKVGDYSDERSPIPGWHVGVTRFREGEKGRLIIPYKLAYGEAGRVTQNVVSIQPYETLVFDIEIVSVNANSDPKTDPDVPD